MKDYFKLQFKLLNRKIVDFGIPLLIGYALIPLIFILLSNFLFSKTEFASYIYVFSAVSLTSMLSSKERNDFLKSIYNKKDYQKLRVLENLIFSFPFILYLLYKGLFIYPLFLMLLIIVISLFNLNTNFNFTIPTPFHKTPFEYIVGFRNTFFIFPITYCLTYISIMVDNINLGVFSILLIGVICFSYYSNLENDYYVWNFNVSPKKFLLKKVKTCLINFTFLILPIVITLTIFFFKETGNILTFTMLCYIYLITIVFAKYSSFPHKMSLPQGIIFAISIMFPPILIVIIPMFFSQSLKKLNTILNND
ncbi:ABC transporter permease [uncultured Lacinutrix sp.]|uniref:ABC transporter permease n=1 Tax=uncultured Lacinutrix sp. TaxID=574032 RepID=UPI00260CD180|nr:ABC transporter permease [uncultured Lacinutrix sp.]